MVQKPLDPATTRTVLKYIHKDMTVYDSNNDNIGTVRDFYFGADSDEMKRHGAGAATAPDPALRESSLIDDIALGLFGKDDLPEEMQQRLINEGFIRIDAHGLFASDRFALADQIDRVVGENIYLNVPGDGLLKP
jgi:hypothetical protein